MTAEPEKTSVADLLVDARDVPPLRLSSGVDAARTWEVDALVTLVGRRRDCDLVVDDASVSNVHCAILYTGRAFVLRDLCSRTGTTVNGERVQTVVLQPGMRVQLGPVDVRIEWPEPLDAQQPQLQPVADLHLHVGAHGVTLGTGVALIGRRMACEVVVDTPDVSPAHALIMLVSGRPAIVDLGSRSGTLVNGERVQIAYVYDGDVIEVGGERLAIRCDDPRGQRPRPAGSTSGDAHRALDAARQRELDEAWQRLQAEREAFEAKARQLEQREAELNTLAELLAMKRQELDRREKQLAEQAATIEQSAEAARERAAFALKHEEAVAAAWRELDRYRAAVESRYDRLRNLTTSHEVSGLTPAETPADAYPVPRPFTQEPPTVRPKGRPPTNA